MRNCYSSDYAKIQLDLEWFNNQTRINKKAFLIYSLNLIRESFVIKINSSLSRIVDEESWNCFYKYNVSAFKNSELYSMELDIFSPCALGAILNSESIKKLKCKIVAGAANNQLVDDTIHDIELKEKNIIFVPDFLINAGGVISVYHEQIQDLSKEKVFGMTENIYSKVEDVLKLSSENDISTNVSAMKIALDRINRNRKK